MHCGLARELAFLLLEVGGELGVESVVELGEGSGIELFLPPGVENLRRGGTY